MNELHLFAGAGGGILAGLSLGHTPVCAVEWEPYAQAVLVARQNDGTFPPFPIWDDVQQFDGKPWRGIVDVVCGGFPCQDISVAGQGAGIDGERSGMWVHMARIICEVQPRYILVENSPALVTRGLGRVLGDLASMGFDAQWGVLGASDFGAPHKRERIWIVAHARSQRHELKDEALCTGRDATKLGSQVMADYAGVRQPESWHQRDAVNCQTHQSWKASNAFNVHGWAAEPGLGRMANGVAHRTHRLKAIGNGQVPRVAAAAFAILRNK